MKQQHHKHVIKKFHKGANRDIQTEFLGSADSGEYYDARNMMPTTLDGNVGALKKIKGENVIYPDTEGSGYVGIGMMEVNNHIIEFWAHPQPTGNDPFIRIDGVVVLKSDKFPISVDFPLQGDKNETCIGGEIFITDYNSPPMLFNVQDLIDSVGTPKYFSDFNIGNYIFELGISPDHPVFSGLENLGGSGGLLVGQYSYSIRYASTIGDRTNWSAPTPLIFIPLKFGTSSEEYPYTNTRGADPGTNSPYSARIKFRVNNIFNYDFIEIRRNAYNAGQFVGFQPVSEIVGRLTIGDGEFSVREFIDDPNAFTPEVIPEEDEDNRLSTVEAAKTIRYFNNRIYLMNIKYANRDVENDVDFSEINGQKMLPIIKRMGKSGHNDPYNHAYHKSYLRGEKYGFGVIFWDGKGGASFVSNVPGFENYQMPNRRDPVSVETDLYSYEGVSTAATVNGTVEGTHEVFDLENAALKDDKCSFINIMDAGFKPLPIVNSAGCPDPGIAVLNNVRATDVGYRPYRPATDSDTDFSGHDYRVNTEVAKERTGGFVGYNPAGFAPNYYSLGMLLSGVTETPSWATAFSVVRTKPASRVVCQGIGFYAMTTATGTSSNNTKEQDAFWFYSPDIAGGLVNIDDIQNNPTNYSVQLVSPLGFFSELYDGDTSILDNKGIDMITYARILREGGNINIGDLPSDIGIGNGYVAYGKYRNPGPNPSNIFANNQNGNAVIQINSFSTQTNGYEGQRGGAYHILRLQQGIYDNGSAGGDIAFNESGIKSWHEPFYIVNIINTGADVNTSDSGEFAYTGNYVKLESTIGISNGAPSQSFELVDERWEDCIPALDNTFPNVQNIDRFVYIEDDFGNQEKWVNVEFKTAAQIAQIKADIIANVGSIRGVYTSTNTGNRSFTIDFSDPDYIPLDTRKIKVKYDPSAPISVYGGDSHVGESIFAPVDTEYDSAGNEVGNTFRLDNGFPYHKYTVNPRVYLINRASGINRIQDDNTVRLKFMRQMVCMFTSESRVNTNLYHNSGYPSDYFPAIHYIVRPHRWDSANPTNNIQPDYFVDYPGEEVNWPFGGFRFLPTRNVDYIQDDSVNIYFKKPQFGFNEETDFCTRIIWSLRRPINVIDSPGLRTFLDTNFFDISDDQGEIKYAFDCLSGKGSNLYAIADNGICLLMTDKRILTQKTGDELAVSGAENSGGVLEQIWLSKEIGMNDEFWRSAAEFNNVLYFTNFRSAYKLENNQLDDLGRKGYHSRLYNEILFDARPGYTDKLVGVYDRLHNQYWVYILQNRVQGLIDFTREGNFAFSEMIGKWVGSYDYRFDQMLSIDNRAYGIKDGKTYEIGVGTEINNQPIRGEVIQAVSPEQYYGKEFIRFRINSNTSPDRIEFFKDKNLTLFSTAQGTDMRNYDGYEQYIPRESAVPNDRLQGREMLFKVIHERPEDFFIVDVGIQYKKLK